MRALFRVFLLQHNKFHSTEFTRVRSCFCSVLLDTLIIGAVMCPAWAVRDLSVDGRHVPSEAIQNKTILGGTWLSAYPVSVARLPIDVHYPPFLLHRLHHKWINCYRLQRGLVFWSEKDRHFFDAKVWKREITWKSIAASAETGICIHYQTFGRTIPAVLEYDRNVPDHRIVGSLYRIGIQSFGNNERTICVYVSCAHLAQLAAHRIPLEQ